MNRQEFEKEREKLSHMTLSEKLSYIFTYYSTQIIILCVAVFLLFQAGGALYRYTQDVLLYCLFADEVSINRAEAELLNSDFREYAGISGKKQVTTFDISLDFSNDTYAEASLIRLSGLYETGTVDVIITTQDMLNQLQDQNLFMDLSDALPGELLKTLSSRLYYTRDIDGETVPMGISLEGSYLDRIMSLEENSYLTIVNMDNFPDTVLKFVCYCFEIK